MNYSLSQNKIKKIVVPVVMLIAIAFMFVLVPMASQAQELEEIAASLSDIAHELEHIAEDMEEIHEDMHKVAFNLRLIAYATIGMFVVMLLNFLVGLFKKK